MFQKFKNRSKLIAKAKKKFKNFTKSQKMLQNVKKKLQNG